MVEALFKDRYDSDIIFDFGNERIIGAQLVQSLELLSMRFSK